MTLNDIADFTTKTVGDVSPDAVEYAKTAVRLKYKTLYDAHLWRESIRTIGVVLDPLLNGIFFLPYDAEEMISLGLSNDGLNFSRLLYRDQNWISRAGGTRYTLQGHLPFYSRLENFAWPYIGPGQITFTTSDLTSFTVFIEGKDNNGNSLSEAFIMNGILQVDGITVTPGVVTTKGSYQYVTSLSKNGGNLSVNDSFGHAVTIGQESAQLVFSQYALYPAPTWLDASGNPIPYSISAQAKLKPDPLNNDMSVPRISHIWDALIEFTLSSLYTRARNLTKADSREQKAVSHIQAAVQIEKSQSESFQQVQPVIYDSGDFLSRFDHWHATSGYPWGW